MVMLRVLSSFPNTANMPNIQQDSILPNIQHIRHIGEVLNTPICDIFGIFDIFGILEHFKFLQYVEYAEYVAYWSIEF